MRSRVARLIVRLLAVAVSAAGMWLSYKLTLDHLEIAGEQGKQGFLDEVCVAFEHSSCEDVSESPWGVFPFGALEDEPRVPTALLGLFYFTAVLCWFVLIGGCTVSRWWAHLIPAAGTAIGLGSSAYLDYVMWAHLERWCPLCLAAHIASLLLFVFALLLWPRRPKPARANAQATAKTTVVTRVSTKPWPHGWMLLVTPIVALLAILAEYLLFMLVALGPVPIGAAGFGLTHLTPEMIESQPAQGTRPAGSQSPAERLKALEKKLQNAEFYRKYWKKQFDRYDKRWQHAYLSWNLTPPVDIPTEGEPVLGPANARHTLVVYSDFQCPHCKGFEDYIHETIMPLGKTRGGLKMIFKHWPICQDCNELASTNLHPLACKASLAAEAARIVGGDGAFWNMYRLLWERRDEWKKTESFVELAREIGLDEEAFSRAMDSDQAMKRIKAHIAEGANLGKGVLKEADHEFVKVHSTPSVFVDNKRVWRMHKTKSLWSGILSTRPRPPARPASSARPGSSSGATTKPVAAGRQKN